MAHLLRRAAFAARPAATGNLVVVYATGQMAAERSERFLN
jgi:hypothetical protein